MRTDYAAMSGMIFGQAPPFDAVLDSIAALERLVNRPDDECSAAR